MKRLAILLIPMLSMGGTAAVAEPAKGNTDLYGSVLYTDRLEASPSNLTLEQENQDLYGSVIWDEAFKTAADQTTEVPQGYGDAYGSILLDVGTDPWGTIEE